MIPTEVVSIGNPLEWTVQDCHDPRKCCAKGCETTTPLWLCQRHNVGAEKTTITMMTPEGGKWVASYLTPKEHGKCQNWVCGEHLYNVQDGVRKISICPACHEEFYCST
jgi:hypothetical protein